MSLSIYQLGHGHYVARLLRRFRRHRGAYATTSNNASHNNYEKINSLVSFTFLWVWGSAIKCTFRARRFLTCLVLIIVLIVVLIIGAIEFWKVKLSFVECSITGWLNRHVFCQKLITWI